MDDPEVDDPASAAAEADGSEAERPDADPAPRDRRLGVEGVLGGVAAFMGLLAGMPRLHDNSFLTHLATGRLILDQGGVPTSDPYSFTAAGTPWVVQSWLASVLYAVAEDVGGFGAIRLLNGLLCAAIAFCVWVLTRRSPSLAVRVVVTGTTIAVASQLLAGRPLLFGMLGLVLVLLAADGRLDPRWLVPVGWVWVNTHGSFPFALLLVGALAIGHRLDEGSWGREVRVGAWAAAGIALGALNPLGIEILTFSTSLLERREAFATVVEWQAPDYSVWSQWAILGLVVLTAASVLRRFRWRDAIPLAGFAVLGLTSQRNQLPLLLVMAPILAGALPAWGPATDSVRLAIVRPARVALVVLVGLFTVAALQQPHLAVEAYPEDAIAWMDERGMWDEGQRVIAPDYVGNFREAQDGADANVFFDDRVDMYPLDVVRDYDTLLHLEDGWEQVLVDREATAVLWRDDTPLGEQLLDHDGWEVVLHRAPWVVAVPADAR